jgi:hypothetical protein
VPHPRQQLVFGNDCAICRGENTENVQGSATQPNRLLVA